MGQAIEFICGVCRHRQMILWGGGFFGYDKDNLADHILKNGGMRNEVRLILQKKDAVLEYAVMMGYYCPICYVWESYLTFSIVSKNIAYTPRYFCKKGHDYLRPVLYENYGDSPWQCEKCGCCGPMMTTESHWD
jgi:hypothetical protein